jgi:hypothetical protein
VHQGDSLPAGESIQDELPFAGKERPVADPAHYFQIDGLRARLSFNNLVESKAAFAAEKLNCIRIRHVAPTSLLAWPGGIIVAHRV